MASQKTLTIKQKQLALFSIDSCLGNSLLDYDQLPRFLHGRSNKVLTSTQHAERPYRQITLCDGEIFQIKPAEIERPSSNENVIDRKYIYPGTRESIVEEAIIDFAKNGEFKWDEGIPGHQYDGSGALKVLFTMYSLRKHLKEGGKEYKFSELREALSVLLGARYKRFVTGDIAVGNKMFRSAQKEYQYLGAVGALSMEEHMDSPIKASDVIEVTLSNEAAQKIISGDYRTYDAHLSLSMDSPVARFLYKTLSQKWLNVNTKGEAGMHYEIRQNETIREAGYPYSEQATKRKNVMKTALDELTRKNVLQPLKDVHVVEKKKGRKVVEVHMLVYPTQDFVDQQISASVRKRKNEKEMALI